MGPIASQDHLRHWANRTKRAIGPLRKRQDRPYREIKEERGPNGPTRISSRQGPTCTTPVKEESEAHGPTTNVNGQKAQRIKGGTRGQAGSMGPHGAQGLPKAIKQDPIAQTTWTWTGEIRR